MPPLLRLDQGEATHLDYLHECQAISEIAQEAVCGPCRGSREAAGVNGTVTQLDTLPTVLGEYWHTVSTE